MSRAANENILESWFTHRHCLDLSGEGLNHFRNKAVRAFALHADLIFENGGFDVKAVSNAFRQQACIMGSIEQHDISADFGLQLRRRAQSYQIAFIHNGQPVAALSFFHEMSSYQDRNTFFIAQDLQVLPEIAARAGVETRSGLVEQEDCGVMQ